jgi:hypothetical protein
MVGPLDDDDKKRHDVDPDVIRPFQSYKAEDVLPGKDYCYRAPSFFASVWHV